MASRRPPNQRGGGRHPPSIRPRFLPRTAHRRHPIGAPDYGAITLMQAINENKSRIKMYGWFDIGGNASTSDKGRYANNETAYE